MKKNTENLILSYSYALLTAPKKIPKGHKFINYNF